MASSSLVSRTSTTKFLLFNFFKIPPIFVWESHLHFAPYGRLHLKVSLSLSLKRQRQSVTHTHAGLTSYYDPPPSLRPGLTFPALMKHVHEWGRGERGCCRCVFLLHFWKARETILLHVFLFFILAGKKVERLLNERTDPSASFMIASALKYDVRTSRSRGYHGIVDLNVKLGQLSLDTR